MKKHYNTMVLLVLGIATFVLSFKVDCQYQVYCNIGGFIFPLLVAIIAVCFAMKSDKELSDVKNALTWKKM